MQVISNVDIDRNWTLRQLIDHIINETDWRKYKDIMVNMDDNNGYLVQVKVIKQGEIDERS